MSFPPNSGPTIWMSYQESRLIRPDKAMVFPVFNCPILVSLYKLFFLTGVACGVVFCLSPVSRFNVLWLQRCSSAYSRCLWVFELLLPFLNQSGHPPLTSENPSRSALSKLLRLTTIQCKMSLIWPFFPYQIIGLNLSGSSWSCLHV